MAGGGVSRPILLLNRSLLPLTRSLSTPAGKCAQTLTLEDGCQEKFSGLTKKNDGDKDSGDEEEEEDTEPGPAPQWEEIKECKSGEKHTWHKVSKVLYIVSVDLFCSLIGLLCSLIGLF